MMVALLEDVSPKSSMMGAKGMLSNCHEEAHLKGVQLQHLAVIAPWQQASTSTLNLKRLGL